GYDAVGKGADCRRCGAGAGEPAELDLGAGSERGAVDEILVGSQWRGCRGRRRYGRGGLLLNAAGKRKCRKCRQDSGGRPTSHSGISIVSRTVAKRDGPLLVPAPARDRWRAGSKAGLPLAGPSCNPQFRLADFAWQRLVLP